MTTVSLHKDYARVTPLTIDATPLNNNTMFNVRTGNNSNSTCINTQETLIGKFFFTQQNIRTHHIL